jgi:hypothetical protein
MRGSRADDLFKSCCISAKHRNSRTGFNESSRDSAADASTATSH